MHLSEIRICYNLRRTFLDSISILCIFSLSFVNKSFQQRISASERAAVRIRELLWETNTPPSGTHNIILQKENQRIVTYFI